MPLYSFTCPCGHEFEAFGNIHRPPEHKKCVACGKRAKRSLKPFVAVPDTFAYPKNMESINHHPVESRTEMRRAMDKYDRKYGTKLVEL